MRIFLSFFLFSLFLKADVLALLLHIDDNSHFHFTYQDQAFSCQTAAVTTLTKLYFKDNMGDACKEEIVHFLKQYPFIPYTAKTTLHEQQKYHLIPYQQNCFIMLNGGITLSQKLLESGYAKLDDEMITKRFSSTALYASLQRAEARARYEGRGFWKNQVLVNCFSGR